LAEHRALLGDEVTVVTGRGAYMKRVGTGAGNSAVRVVRVWTAQLGSQSVVRRLIDWLTFYMSAMARVLMLPPQDVIISMTTPPYIVLAGVLKKLLCRRTRIILWNMDCYPEAVERTGMIRDHGMLGQIMRWINRRIFRRLDHLVCLDSAMRDLLMSQYAPSGRQLPCTIIPNWESAELFSSKTPIPAWEDPIVEQLKGKLVVLYLGNAGFGHEFATMLDAAEKLRDQPIVFFFVGGGAMRPWILRQVSSRNLSNILLHDYVAKELTPSVTALADCALITLEDYAAGVMSPSKLHANLAMGLAILYIGPHGSNVDEAIQRFGCGVSVRIGQAAAACEFLSEMTKDPERKAQLKQRARQAFEQAYCDRQTLPQFDAILDGLCRAIAAGPDACG
jgi:glycosyltransferase involved in cell wall biosynthesis